ncbi:sensor histidine kinase [Undibacterium sp. TJN25]|uniref:sensor histidine kinase n=1 Tax=Undibacterium sp. TJN25 TaxID=3413056 RepID=UPI003BF38890
MSQGEGSGFMPLLREIGATASALWWSFFNWLAVVSWRNLAIICFIAMVVAGMANMPEPAVMFAFVSFGVKVLAGGKRRAELAADAAITRANVEALERRLLEAQMAMLQAQVEPHFLFNTLALIGQLIETDPPQAARIHHHLIQYLRSALPQMRDKGGGTLGRQMELSRAYLAIMQARMRDRLTVSIELPAGLADAPFPPMMIQTLVENSIKHGLEPKTAGGHIDIRASVRDMFLHVEVIDDGVGFNLHAGDGIGLANIRERLKMLFGAGAQLIIEAPAQGGAYTCIRVPYQKNGAFKP